MDRAELKSADHETAIPVPPFLALPVALRNRVTRCILRKVKKDLRRIDQGHIRAVYDLALGEKPQGVLSLPRGLRVERIYDTLLVTRNPLRANPIFHYALEGPGKTYIPEIGRSITILELKGETDQVNNASPKTAYLNGDKLHFPLVLRNFKPGDRFVPLGMSGHRKVKDFFIDLNLLCLNNSFHSLNNFF